MKMDKAREHTLEGQFGPLLRGRTKTSGGGLGAQCFTSLSQIGVPALSSWFVDRKFSSESLSKKTDVSNGMNWEIKIRVLDMKEAMKDEVISLAIEALEKYTVLKLKEIASYIQRHFEKKYGGSWHCIVGNAFGYNVTCIEGRCIFFDVDELGFYLFQSDP